MDRTTTQNSWCSLPITPAWVRFIFTVVDVGGWYLLRPGTQLAKTLYLALAPVAPLYLGLACAQFLPGPRWLGAARGVAAWLIGYGLMQAIVIGLTYAFDLAIHP